MLVATVAAAPEATVQALRSIHDVDVVEVRLDSWWIDAPRPEAATDALLRAVEAASVPLMATLRPARQGGRYDGPEDVRLGLLVAAARAGFAYVDLEGDLAAPHDALRLLRAAGARIVSSDHRLPTTPARDEGLRHLTALQDLGTDIQKLAVPAGSFADTLRCMELVHVHAARTGAPAIAPLPAPAALRALLAVAGNTLTYGHAGTPAAAGQPAAADIRAVWRHWGLGSAPPAAHRAWYAVLGRPVAQSLSPRLHNAALQAAGRRELYGALEVPDSIAAMRLLATVAPRLGLAGANVTAPHKAHAAQVAQGDALVQATGAANTLRFTAEGATATNTDATAFVRLLRPVAGGRLVILGAGGAARAAAFAAKEHGCRVHIAARDPQRAAAVAAACGAEALAWDTWPATEADAWIQATPAPQPAPVWGEALAIDLQYTQPSPWGDAPRFVDGRAFLLEQAVDAYVWWHGSRPDREAMAAALAGPVGP